MNKKDIERRRQKIKSAVSPENRGNGYWREQRGVKRHGDRWKHFLIKASVFQFLSDQGHEVLTEVEIHEGYKVDVLDAETALIYEIETGLTKKSRRSKLKRYLDPETDFGRVVEDIVFIDPEDLPDDIHELKDEIEAYLTY